MDRVRSTQIGFDRGTLLIQRHSRGRPPTSVRGLQWDGRVNAWRCDASLYRALLAGLAGEVGRVDDRVPRWQRVRWGRVEMPSLRPYQLDAVSAWMEEKSGCAVMPTGTGKTEVALAIMARLKISTLVVAPLLALAHQWVDRIRVQLGYDAGMVGDRVRNLRPVTVTTYASACIQMPVLGNRFGLVVFDECHHLPAPVLGDAARMSAAPLRLGLTATPPCEPDRRAALEALIGPIVYELPITAVRGRAIADYEIIRIPTPLSDAERATYRRWIVQLRRYAAEAAAASCRSGSAGKTEAAAAGNRNHVQRTLLGDPGLDPVSRSAITAYRRKRALENAAESKLTVLGELFGLHLGEPCLVFTGSNAAALAVSRRFLIPCLLNHTSRRERRDILAGFGEGRFPAVVANRVLDEGIDLPDVKVAIVLGGTASSRQAQQRLGRLLRKRGASKAVLYEIVTAATSDESRARRRASNDAYQGTCCRRR